MIIAIDGPSGSGKGTISRLLGQTLNLAVLDTGLLYRLFGLRVLERGIDPADMSSVLTFLKTFTFTVSDLSIPTLREDHVASAASRVSQYPEVRQVFLEFQQNFAKTPPPPYQGAILDGRDIGTVILPHADLKIFITACVEVRAQRRWKELQGRGVMCMLDDVLRDLQARDERDMHRACNPLKPASDAYVIDTSTLSPSDVVHKVLEFLNSKSLNSGR